VIHWSDRLATAVGLPGVIAHGMFTMAQAARYVAELAGDPGAVTELAVRFSGMVSVPDTDEGTTVEVSGTVTAELEDGRLAIDLVAKQDGTKVLTRARAVIRPSAP
jgi:acyl dehydratase